MNCSNALKLAESANAEVDVTRKRASTNRSEVDVESTRENGLLSNRRLRIFLKDYLRARAKISSDHVVLAMD